MRLKSRLALVIGLFFTMVCFQNCGKLSSGLNSSDSSNNGNSSNAAFFRGDPYDASLIPFEITDEMAMNAITSYNERQGFKSMAFTESGNVFISSSGDPNVQDQADWDQAILERCQLEFMNQPCSLFASGDIIAQNREDFLVGFISAITIPATFDGLLVPGAINHWQTHAEQTYPEFDPGQFKSFAVGPDGATHAGWSPSNQAEASRRALEFCEAIRDRPCALYAVGINVIFDLESYQWDQRRIHYGPRPLNIDEIPFIDDTLREVIRTEQSEMAHYALALDRFGAWKSLRSATPITQVDIGNILDACDAKIPAPVAGGSPRSCFVYSVDDQVIMTRSDYTMANYGY